MVSLEYAENQNSELAAKTSEVGTLKKLLISIASDKHCYRKVYQSILMSEIKRRVYYY